MQKVLFCLLFQLTSFHAFAIFVIDQPSTIVYAAPEGHPRIEDILRYGTPVNISKEQGEWAYVTYADWQGWILKNALLEVNESEDETISVNFRGAYLYEEPDTEWGPFLHLPFEAPLKLVEELPQSNRRWVLVKLQNGKQAYVARAYVRFSQPVLSLSEAIEFSKNFLGLKYLWGGATSFGYDCSGFVQMLFRQMGIKLPRNSYQQAEDAQFLDVPSENAQAGDLVFFKNLKGSVVHVGMMVDANQFIHSSPREQACIVISPFADKKWENGELYYGKFLRRLKSKR